MPYKISPGTPAPYGNKVDPKGVNFSIFVEGNPKVELVLFNPHSKEVTDTIDIPFQTGQVKHLFVEGLTLPLAYLYQVYRTPNEPYLLLDPYAKAIKSPVFWEHREEYRPLGLVIQQEPFNWGYDKRPGIPKEDLIIYEMHVRGYTADKDSSHVSHPGTFKAITEKIQHLKSLGVNAIELLPIFEFNESEYDKMDPINHKRLFQYWGYSTVNYFQPMNRYASSDALGASIVEFKEMVRELHKAGIEVILDIVFNHTAEGNDDGPILSFKGFASSVYYILDKEGRQTNFSGCGNTVNCNHPVVIEWILDVLRYWVVEMHIDGFRFDLGSIFYRGKDGAVLATPPVIDAITKDPTLANTKLITEPWDAAGFYQVGSFYTESPRWSEWNGRYRDCVRKFIKGDISLRGEFAGRLTGSEDLYGHDRRLPRNSINFIVAHDGFCLRDLVSYNEKHNESNGEENRDGMNENDSWNCGIEGETDDPEVLKLREKQLRNFHVALMVSQGIPMIMMGDEYGHTKKGNNNTWCHDDFLNWFLWHELEKKTGFHRFYKGLIQFRRHNPILKHRKFLKEGDVQWHGLKPSEPIWEKESSFIAFTLIDKSYGQDLYIAFNAQAEAVEITLPPPRTGKTWRLIAYTALPSPQDFNEDNSVQIVEPTYKMEAYSSLILKAS